MMPRLEPPLEPTAVQRFYRLHAAIYDWTRWAVLHRRSQAIRRLELRPASDVLEIGCGTGLNFAAILRELDPRQGWLTGLDFSPHMLKRARRRVSARGWTNVTLLQADAAALSLPQFFDSILFSYSLSMIPAWEAAVRQATEHLKPGGRLVILDFGDFHGWGPLGRLVRGWLRLHHVTAGRAYYERLPQIVGPVEFEVWLGGYAIVATARKARPRPN